MAVSDGTWQKCALVVVMSLLFACSSDAIELHAPQDAGATDRGSGGSGGGTCTTNGECSSGEELCHLDLGRCVECLVATDCTEPGTACDSATFECRETCASDVDCSSDQSHCDTARHVCVDCATDTDCSGGQPFCHTPTGRCVVCLGDMHCPAGSFCDPEELECRG